MYEHMTPGERLERIARLLVKAMYLSLDGRDTDALGSTGRPDPQRGDEVEYRSMRLGEDPSLDL